MSKLLIGWAEESLVHEKFAAEISDVDPMKIVIAATHTHTSHTLADPTTNSLNPIANTKEILGEFRKQGTVLRPLLRTCTNEHKILNLARLPQREPRSLMHTRTLRVLASPQVRLVPPYPHLQRFLYHITPSLSPPHQNQKDTSRCPFFFLTHSSCERRDNISPYAIRSRGEGHRRRNRDRARSPY